MWIEWPVLLAALLSGALGGVHCLAMCGGLATGLSACGVPGQPARTALLLNGGRIGGYALAGGIVGSLGSGLLAIARTEGLAAWLRAGVGVVMVLVALRLWRPQWFRAPSVARLGTWRALQWLRLRLVPKAGPWRPLVTGLFWGWLPCGLSTLMLAAAWLQASAVGGAMLMLAFGLGTLPLMAALSWTGARGGRWLARPELLGGAALLVATLGLLTLAAPALAQVPAAHAALAALGCLPRT
jgi:uncharacterized protein